MFGEETSLEQLPSDGSRYVLPRLEQNQDEPNSNPKITVVRCRSSNRRRWHRGRAKRALGTR